MERPNGWQPIAMAKLPEQFGDFSGWVLCGGHSVDLLAGRCTRAHGDVDVGVFRSELDVCLRAVGIGRVFLCASGGGHELWEGAAVDPAIHDIWISDAKRQWWEFQIMVFDDEGDEVIYRRDRRVRWPKECHAVTVGSVRVLNPLVTFLFKAHRSAMVEKEVFDLQTLIRVAAEKFASI